jgi:AcrR family transcriptional regulator
MPYLARPTPDPEPIDCRILTASLDLFVNNGFHNVSVHDVQKVADVSIGSIYKHFGGKEGIAKALYARLLTEMNEMVDMVIQQRHTPIERCNRVIELLFEYTETRTNIIAYVFHSKHSEFISDEAPICSAEPFVRIREIVQQGIQQGDIQPCDSWVASSAIFGGAIRLIHLRLEGIIERPLTELYPEVIERTWQGMTTRPESLNLEVKKAV